MELRHIIIVEDERSIAETILFAVKREGFEATMCANGIDALKAVRDRKPALVILDVGLPDRSGFDVCKDIRQISQVPIIFLSARAEEVDRILGLELGADDYITKPFSPRELVARVRAILRRNRPEPGLPQPKRAPHFVMDTERMCIHFRKVPLELSRYEFRMLAVLIRYPGKVFSREELMNRAWETPEMSLERTIDTHIKTIRSKLREIDSNDDSILTHRGIGYSLKEGQ